MAALPKASRGLDLSCKLLRHLGLGVAGSQVQQHSPVYGEKNLTMAGSLLKVSFPQGSQPSS